MFKRANVRRFARVGHVTTVSTFPLVPFWLLLLILLTLFSDESAVPVHEPPRVQRPCPVGVYERRSTAFYSRHTRVGGFRRARESCRKRRAGHAADLHPVRRKKENKWNTTLTIVSGWCERSENGTPPAGRCVGGGGAWLKSVARPMENERIISLSTREKRYADVTISPYPRAHARPTRA